MFWKHSVCDAILTLVSGNEKGADAEERRWSASRLETRAGWREVSVDTHGSPCKAKSVFWSRSKAKSEHTWHCTWYAVVYSKEDRTATYEKTFSVKRHLRCKSPGRSFLWSTSRQRKVWERAFPAMSDALSCQRLFQTFQGRWCINAHTRWNLKTEVTIIEGVQSSRTVSHLQATLLPFSRINCTQKNLAQRANFDFSRSFVQSLLLCILIALRYR